MVGEGKRETDAAATLERELKQIYRSPADPGSYGGIEKLYTRAKQLRVRGVTRAKVRAFLQADSSYTLHRQARRHFHRNPTYVSEIDEQWQADLADMQALSRQNHGTKYLLTVIDVFSKFAWAIPLKAKSAPALVDGFNELFKQASPRRPRRLQTDKGKEFLNTPVQSLLRNKYQVEHFTSWSDQKAAVVERFNRTLKTRMWRYFTAHQTHHYLDVLAQLVDAYNHSWHRSIGTTPAQVRKRNEPKIRRRLFPGRAAAAAAAARAPAENSVRGTEFSAHPAKPKGETDELLRPGLMVRISRVKGDFEKGYKENWSQEDFRIRDFTDRPGQRRVYKLADRSGEPVQGVWYREELQPIRENKFLVERIIRRRQLPAGVKECLVQWQGWPKKFNSWVPETDLEDIAAAAANGDD